MVAKVAVLPGDVSLIGVATQVTTMVRPLLTGNAKSKPGTPGIEIVGELLSLQRPQARCHVLGRDIKPGKTKMMPDGVHQTEVRVRDPLSWTGHTGSMCLMTTKPRNR